MTDANGQVVARERYTAFGERRRGESPTTTDYLYTDQRYSAFVGFYHYTSGGPGRMYDPLLARFLQADPVTPDGSQGLNRFSYVLNNPFIYTDPSGHDPFGGLAWDHWFEETYGRSPEWWDRMAYLFTLSFPDEGLDLDNFFRHPSYIAIPWLTSLLKDSTRRSWNNVEDALDRLSKYYYSNELDLFIWDVGFLFAGIRSRFDRAVNSMFDAFTAGFFPWNDHLGHPQTGYGLWVYVGGSGLPEGLRSSFSDNNIHHFAWAMWLGYQFDYFGGVANELFEAWQRFRDPRIPPWETAADRELGWRAANFGQRLREYTQCSYYGPCWSIGYAIRTFFRFVVMP